MSVAEAKNIFFRYVKDKKLRDTKQREEIIKEFLSTDKHITAEELYYRLKKRDPNIGYATICRTLKLMSECGIANEIKLGSNKTRFEQKFEHEHHDHLICLKCGQFIEAKDNNIERLQEKLAKKYKFSSKYHKLEIYGICKKCN